jgi:hypothetical protein
VADAHGNTGSASFSVTVHDSTAPVVTVPANAVVEATSASGTAYTFSASAIDTVDGTVVTTCDPASGSTFAIGTTTVACWARDAHGNTAAASFTITVLKMTPLITWNVPADITYGTALSGAELNATANVTGSFVYTPPAGTVLNAGAGQTLSGVFTPADGATYTTATMNSNITVLKAIPTTTWAAPGAITYGTVLTGAQLSATANVPGSFAYTPGNGVVLDAGMRTLSAIFTPTDVTNYASVTATTEVLVATAALAVTAASHTKTYGAANPTLTVSYSGFVNGDTATSLAIPALVTTAATTSSPVGTYPITASGAVSANYTISYVTGTLAVTRAVLTVTADNQTKTYGAANPVLTVTCLGFVNGDTAASLTVQPTVTTTATISSPAGTYPITASGAESANYTITHVNGMLTVVASSGPVATNDSYTTTQATALTVASPGVLANDTGGTLTAVLSGAPAHGALVLNANGGFRYAPSASYIGTDTFRYQAKDSSGTLSGVSTVTIAIKSFQ